MFRLPCALASVNLGGCYLNPITDIHDSYLTGGSMVLQKCLPSFSVFVYFPHKFETFMLQSMNLSPKRA